MSQLRLLQMGGSLGSPAYQVKTGSTPCEYPNAEGCRGSQTEDGGRRGKGVKGLEHTTGFGREEDGPGSSKEPGRSSPGDFRSGGLIAWDF